MRRGLRNFFLRPVVIVLLILLPTIGIANLTKHTEGLLDMLLLNLDSDGDGQFTDEAWYQNLASKLSGTSPAASITDAGSGIVISTTERTKLNGIEAGAQVNPPDATDQEMSSGTEASTRLMSPAQIKLALNSNETDPVVGAVNGLVKSNGAGTISAATAGSDYLTPTGDGSALSGVVKSESDPIYGSSAAASITNAGSGSVITTAERTKVNNALVGDGSENPSFASVSMGHSHTTAIHVSALPGSPSAGDTYWVDDATDACTIGSGGGSVTAPFGYDGSAWVGQACSTGSGMSALVDDTDPHLGGDLHSNGHNIVLDNATDEIQGLSTMSAGASGATLPSGTFIYGGPNNTDLLVATNAAGTGNVVAVKVGSDDHTYVGGVDSTTWLTAASTNDLTNKSYDANGTGNTLKGYGYITLPSPMVFGTDTTQETTSSTRVYGQALFSNSAAVTNNYVEYILEVPRDLDTSVDLVAWFKFTLSGADTGDQDYVISMVSIDDSGANGSSVGDAVNLDYTADANGASGDVETAGGNTLTGWAAAVTPGSRWIIRVARSGDSANDGSTVDSYSGPLTIRYGFTQ